MPACALNQFGSAQVEINFYILNFTSEAQFDSFHIVNIMVILIALQNAQGATLIILDYLFRSTYFWRKYPFRCEFLKNLAYPNP